jgi:hypothetical protein
MTQKEHKMLDMVMFSQHVANIRDIDPLARLNALAWDLQLVREGKKPTASREIVENQK